MRTIRCSSHLSVQVVSAWGVSASGGVCPGACTPPLDRILDTRLWKHYLSATSFADGNKQIYDMLLVRNEFIRTTKIIISISQTPNCRLLGLRQINIHQELLHLSVQTVIPHLDAKRWN